MAKTSASSANEMTGAIETNAGTAYLDGLRALAANMVVVSHVRQHWHDYSAVTLVGDVPYGSLGVTIFFLLSGFWITGSLLRRFSEEAPQLPAFLADRVARVMTPYLPALSLVAMVNVIVPGPPNSSDASNSGPLAFLGNVLLLQEHALLHPFTSTAAKAGFIRSYTTAEPFWTIAVEMWIYVAVGLFAFCAIRRERVDKRCAIGLAVVSVPTVIWNAAAGGGKCLTLTWIIGAMAALLLKAWRARGFANARAIGWILTVLGSIALLGRAKKVGFHPYDFQTAFLLSVPLFGAFAILSVARRTTPWVHHLTSKLAAYSYSLYLVHNTCLIVAKRWLSSSTAPAQIVIGALVAHATALVFYLAFERHYRQVGAWLRPWLERAMTRPTQELDRAN